MNSRSLIKEAHEHENLKIPPIICVWRNYDKPIPKWRKGLNKWIDRRRRPTQWKVELYNFALSLLPAALAFHATVALSDTEPDLSRLSTALYVLMLVIVVFLKGLSRKVADDNLTQPSLRSKELAERYDKDIVKF